MDDGQVGFHTEKIKRYVPKVKKDKIILKLLTKTKKESYPDLEKEKNQYLLDRKREKIYQFKAKKEEEILEKNQYQFEKE